MNEMASTKIDKWEIQIAEVTNIYKEGLNNVSPSRMDKLGQMTVCATSGTEIHLWQWIVGKKVSRELLEATQSGRKSFSSWLLDMFLSFQNVHRLLSFGSTFTSQKTNKN